MYCYRCGVMLEPDALKCPLCGTPVPEPGEREAGDHEAWNNETGSDHPVTGFPSDRVVSIAGERRWGHAETARVLSLLLLTPLVPLIAIWYVQEPGMEWILWAAGILAAVWLMLVPLRPLTRILPAYAAVVAVAIAGLTVAVDASVGDVDWSLRIFLPVAAMTFLSVAAVYIASSRFTQWGLPVLGVGATVVALTVTVADGLINRLYGEPFIGVSAILLVIAVPTATVSWYLHSAVGVRVDLRKLFHL